ncbi:MAG: HAMP domain-containing histidine kinase [Deltaproteobacteria bacterium]|nr:HAMP domain-containing histidine kinase [Deltaproteobacteria bacterium]
MGEERRTSTGNRQDEENDESLSLGSVLTSEGFSKEDEEFGEAADQALKQRPSFSIRLRLILSFAIIFLLPFLITLWIMHTLANLQDKILFLEVADDYKVEIQQARRFEKNYLLYGTNLNDALEHVVRAEAIFKKYEDRFRKVIGEDALDEMAQNSRDYIKILRNIPESQNERPQMEKKLRSHGALMVSLAQKLTEKERVWVQEKMELMRRVPFIFLLLLLLLMILLVGFLARHILNTLNRFIGYTQRIAAGDFTPITPARRYRDEFSVLALYINRMVRALDRHHRILVESHKLRAMGTLVAGVAHELNNPMNNILLTASVLQEDYLELDEEERKEMLDDLVAQAERTRKIVANLLGFARQSKAVVETLDIRKILEETVELIGNQLRVKKIKLHFDVPEKLPMVHGDHQLLNQVFMNLIMNAADVLPEKGEIKIKTSTDQREGFLAVDVSDNGPGIPEHILSRIFDPFFTTKPKGQGTGLGLSVSRGIIRKLGGYLLARSTFGQGSTFTVLLPITTIPSMLSARQDRERKH